MSQRSMFAVDKEARMDYDDEDQLLTENVYNLILGGVVLYGLIVNVIMCKVCESFFTSMNPIVFLIGYFVMALSGTFIANRSDNPVISFLGYNLVVFPIGGLLTLFVQSYSSSLIFQAFLVTAIISLVMMAAATAFPRLFEGLGTMLFVALVGLIIARVVCLFLSIDPVLLSWIGAGIFSVYIGYDWVKAQNYAMTPDNAVDSALDIYLDLINLFMNVLRILGSRN